MSTVMMPTSPTGPSGVPQTEQLDMTTSRATDSSKRSRGSEIADESTQPCAPDEESAAEIVYEVDEDHERTSSRSIRQGSSAALGLGQTTMTPAAQQSTPALTAMALAITSQEWRKLGLGGPDKSVASNDFAVTVERITSLFLIRLVALVSSRSRAHPTDDTTFPMFADYSTTTVCRSTLVKKATWPKPITASLITNLRTYLRRILEQYNGVHYHNFEHAYHVTISANKLLDLMLLEENPSSPYKRKTFGLKADPLMHLAVLFSALIHDVDHKGVSNRQLVLEGDELAILYNDQSVAEQRSLAVAFSELRKPEFEQLRQIMFGHDNSEYMRFRAQVINLVLATDIASPERTQLVKSKWKEAFGNETKKYVEKQRQKMLGQSQGSSAFRGSLNSSITNGQLQSSMSSPSQQSSLQPDMKSMTASSSSGSTVSDNNISIMPRQRQSKVSLLDSLSSIQSEDDRTTSSSERDVMDGVIQSGKTMAASSPTRNPITISTNAEPTPPSTPPPPPDTTPRAGNHSPADLQYSLKGKLSPVLSSRHLEDNVSPLISASKKSQSPPRENSDDDNHHESPQLLRRSTDSVVAASQRMYASAPMFSNSILPPGFRRYSSGDVINPYRKSMRLGIRRSLDFTGEAIEPYSAVRTTWSSPAAAAASLSSGLSASMTTPRVATSPKGDTIAAGSSDEMDDEPDELKATVVMEHLLRAADVGPNLQGWDHMKKWSGRLFFELKSSHEAGRCGFDPQQGWYQNQITFLDAYVMPLAQKLQMTGVFGTSVQFDSIVEQNRQRWTGEGRDVTAETIRKWQLM